MAYDRDPKTPPRADDSMREAARLDNELQPDPELAEGPASNTRVTLIAIGIAVVLGIVFYGLNNSSINPGSTGTTTAQNAAPPKANPPTNMADQTKPPVPPGVRDVTPQNNSQPGVTTGAAPAHPQKPPSSGPAGTEVDRSASPPPANSAGQTEK
jgi:hypothetical protein